MFKKAFAVILIYSILLQGGTKLGIYAFFKVNQDYIARVLCINKDKPSFRCNGKCYLSKQLKAQEEKDKKAPVELKTAKVILFCSSTSFIISKPAFVCKSFASNLYLFTNYLVDQPSIFHPPLA